MSVKLAARARWSGGRTRLSPSKPSARLRGVGLHPNARVSGLARLLRNNAVAVGEISSIMAMSQGMHRGKGPAIASTRSEENCRFWSTVLLNARQMPRRLVIRQAKPTLRGSCLPKGGKFADEGAPRSAPWQNDIRARMGNFRII